MRRDGRTIAAMDLDTFLGRRDGGEHGGVVLLDGALGTQLLVSGFDAHTDLLDAGGPEALCATRPEQVRAVHESYLDAGARVLTTNTFGASPRDLAVQGLGSRFEAIAAGAVRAAREAARAWADEVPDARVLGALGPGLDADQRRASDHADAVAPLAERLLELGVDGLVLETATRLDHLAAAYERVLPLVRARGGVLVASFAFTPKRRLLDGADARAIAAWADAARPDLLAANCGTGPEATAAELADLRAHWSGPLAALPTAGEPAGGDLTRFGVDAAAFADAVAPWVERFDLVAVGGCCGTTPRHIAALGDALGLARPWIETERADDEEDALL